MTKSKPSCPRLWRAIKRLSSPKSSACGSTALHAGWLEGGTQVAAHLESERLNRVLLLTDGLANQGEVNPDRICSDVRGLASRGVSTTAMGVGDDFNEDLLEQMAKSGDGNYYFIEGAADLERIFAAELSGLMATVGRKVSLGLEAQNGAEILEVLTKLERNELGRLQLSNLVASNTLEVVLKLRVPALKRAGDVLFCRLAFDAPEISERQVLREALSLSGVSEREWDAAPFESSVQSAAAKLQLARERESIGAALDSGDMVSGLANVKKARQMALAAPMSAEERDEEMAGFDAIESGLEKGNSLHAAKRAKYDAYRRHQSR